MTSTPIRSDPHGYLRDARGEVVRALEDLDDGYQIRRPMTPTGTNLLGIVKHLIGIEAGYIGLSLGQPFPEPLPWVQDPNQESPNADMWATEHEPKDYILDLYERACAHSDAVLEGVTPDTVAVVPWWPEPRRQTTAATVLLRVLKDTATHAGQLQILRELTDGQAGVDRDLIGDEAWWRSYTQRIEAVARQFS